MVKRLLIATFVAVSPLLAVAQGLITGHITDARTGEPLIGASVIVKSEKGQAPRRGCVRLRGTRRDLSDR